MVGKGVIVGTGVGVSVGVGVGAGVGVGVGVSVGVTPGSTSGVEGAKAGRVNTHNATMAARTMTMTPRSSQDFALCGMDYSVMPNCRRV
jgi:hypothetical protein